MTHSTMSISHLLDFVDEIDNSTIPRRYEKQLHRMFTLVIYGRKGQWVCLHVYSPSLVHKGKH